MSLQVWLPLNGDLYNQGLNGDLTVVNSGATIDNSGKIGKCYSFNGSNNYIALNSSKLYDIFQGGSQAFSVAMWIYHADTTRAIIFGDYGLPGSISFNIELNEAHRVRFYWANSPSKTFAVATAVEAAKWTHIVLTYNGSELLIYKNGLLQNDKWSGMLTTKNKTTGNFYLGRDNRTDNTAFNGRLNDFRIYDHCLSAKEVEEISKGLILHYKLDEPNENLVVNGLGLQGISQGWTAWGTASNRTIEHIDGKTWFHHLSSNDTTKYGGFVFTSASMNIAIEPNTQYTVSAIWFADQPITCRFWFHMRSTEGGANISQPSKNIQVTTTPQVYSYTFNSGSNASYTINRFALMMGSYHSDTSINVYFTDVKMEKGNAITNWCPSNQELGDNASVIYDSSGYSNNGIIVGNLTAITPSPRYDAATVFNNSPYIKKTNFNYTSNIWSVSCWFKKTSTITNFETICGLSRSNGSDANKKFSIYIKDTTLGFVGESVAHSSITTTDKTLWHHVCVTSDGNSHKFYLDGVLKSTFSNTTNLTDCTDLVIGGRAAAINASSITTSWGGNISDVRIYATALTDTQIKELYSTSMSIDSFNNIHARELVEL